MDVTSVRFSNRWWWWWNQITQSTHVEDEEELFMNEFASGSKVLFLPYSNSQLDRKCESWITIGCRWFRGNLRSEWTVAERNVSILSFHFFYFPLIVHVIFIDAPESQDRLVSFQRVMSTSKIHRRKILLSLNARKVWFFILFLIINNI